jgi:subtilase family serine protease
VGGTEISSTDDAVGPYFSAALSTGNGTALTTALSYIPEVAWNDDSVANGIGSSGGGVSTLYTTQPSYQSAYFTATGETNPDSTARLVPDVALYSSPDLPGYLYCTSDQSDWYNGAQGGQPQAASCGASEFFDDITGYFNVAGGTSFAAPIFAGMMALVNQKAGYTTGQGLLNPTLYSLASNSATAFHDVTSGNNYCTAGTANGCPSNGATLGYAAGAGYDLVTGLGSVDVNALATAYPASTSTLIATSTTLSAANTAPLVNTADNITIAVASDTGATVPTGTVSVSVNGGTPATYTLTANGTYVDAVTFTTAGTATVVANYSGDATHAASTGTVSVTVGGVSTGKGSITLAATNLTLTAGNNGNSTVTVTPAGGYQGTVGLQLSASNSNLSFCYTLSNVVVSGTAATFTTQLNIDTNLNDCNQGAVRKGTTAKHLFVSGHNSARLNQGPSTGFGPALGLACIFAGLFGWRQRRFRVFLSLLVLAGFGLTLTACGGVTNNNNFTSKGTYTLTLTGTDSVTSTITNTTTFTLVVQ